MEPPSFEYTLNVPFKQSACEGAFLSRFTRIILHAASFSFFLSSGIKVQTEVFSGCPSLRKARTLLPIIFNSAVSVYSPLRLFVTTVETRCVSDLKTVFHFSFT